MYPSILREGDLHVPHLPGLHSGVGELRRPWLAEFLVYLRAPLELLVFTVTTTAEQQALPSSTGL